MAQVTIQCRLIAPESTRKALWALAAEKNTPLINELIQQVVDHPGFDTWRQKGRHPANIVAQACKPLKQGNRFAGQPARFYASAEKMVNYIFKSWFKIQLRLQQRLSGKQKWLDILKSDQELIELCGQDLETIQEKATQLLKQLEKGAKQKASQPSQGSIKNTIRQQLFKRYNSSKQALDRCAAAYLLKSGCKLPTQPEDAQKFTKRRRKSKLQVQRLQRQIESRIPKGRDLTGQDWLSTLSMATATVPKDNLEHKRWQDRLLSQPSTIPFPILFETNEDLIWSLNSKGRICVCFNGFSEHTFQIYCDQRQLPKFKFFLKDQQTKRASKNQHSSALFALRSARISWQETDNSGDPWDKHSLTLSCTLDERLLSAEGTDEVRQEKAADVAKILTRLNEKECLSDTQTAYARRLTSTLNRLESPFDRPSRPLYQGQAQIIVGLSLGWEMPLTLAIWRTDTQEILAYRSLKQLLGKDYPLFLKQRQEQQKQSHQRHKAQRKGKGNQFGTSNLGQHVDRLLAKAVVNTAKQYGAGSVAIPKLDNMRDILQAEIEAKAEQRIPGYLEGQKRYTKQYKSNIHKWSYGRLVDQVVSKAAQTGLVIEESRQPRSGTPQEKAKAVAIVAYESRKSVHQN